ncbi:hypothetical protein A3K63_03010 [Candidatus Micrarchaeota archaeon RBG_16_49_10]|nr:MAG: hypothetical protein A3K63_03010 [Candidatus Micrarchaeota archaeon RBG_16_49_10]
MPGEQAPPTRTQVFIYYAENLTGLPRAVIDGLIAIGYMQRFYETTDGAKRSQFYTRRRTVTEVDDKVIYNGPLGPVEENDFGLRTLRFLRDNLPHTGILDVMGHPFEIPG